MRQPRAAPDAVAPLSLVIAQDEVPVGNGEALMTVFMPNAPNPTTGFVMFMPAKDVTLLDMSIEDGAKMVVSAGLVPPSQDAVQKLAQEARAKKAIPEEEPVV